MASLVVDGHGPGIAEREKYPEADKKEACTTSALRVSISGSAVHDDTHRKLKSRHIQLIGIGGSIGTALY
ncbi:hypothetical protein E4U53_007923, partial [Claviceps sorghi]